MNKHILITDNRLITFHLSGGDYAVPIAVVREVISAEKIDQLPGGRKPLEGLMIYRENQVLPVFSLTQALGLENESLGDLILVVKLNTQMLGFRVEKIGRVIGGSGSHHYEPLEEELALDPGTVQGTFIEEGLRVNVLKLEKVFGNVLN